MTKIISELSQEQDHINYSSIAIIEDDDLVRMYVKKMVQKQQPSADIKTYEAPKKFKEYANKENKMPGVIISDMKFGTKDHPKAAQHLYRFIEEKYKQTVKQKVKDTFCKEGMDRTNITFSLAKKQLEEAKKETDISTLVYMTGTISPDDEEIIKHTGRQTFEKKGNYVAKILEYTYNQQHTS
ncbi:MAG: hypothetical protein ACQESC_01930 [Nanobdellota archaeon]